MGWALLVEKLCSLRVMTNEERKASLVPVVPSTTRVVCCAMDKGTFADDVKVKNCLAIVMRQSGSLEEGTVGLLFGWLL